MIVLTATLLNANGRAFDVPLGVVTIINDGSGTMDRGNYRVSLKTDGRRRGKVRMADVIGFPRRSRSTWEILRRALNEMAERGVLP